MKYLHNPNPAALKLADSFVGNLYKTSYMPNGKGFKNIVLIKDYHIIWSYLHKECNFLFNVYCIDLNIHSIVSMLNSEMMWYVENGFEKGWEPV